MPPRTSLLTAAVVVGITAHAAATCIIVFRTPTRIVLAGDSRSVAGLGSASNACKIRRAGRWSFVLGGLQRVGHLDLFAAVERAIATKPTTREALAALRPLSGRLREALATARSNPLFGEFDPGDQLVNVLVAGIDHGTPTVGYFNVTLTSKEPLKLNETALTCPGAACPDGRLFYGSAIVDEPAMRLLTTTPRPAWLELADAAAARRLIALQIAATPDTVGGPIDVLEIRADGHAAWTGRDRASVCAALPSAPVRR
jgi:hypothetical protein